MGTENSGIKNAALLGKTPLRQKAIRLAEVALAAIGTGPVIRRVARLAGQTLSLAGQTYDLQGFRRVLLVAIGKCALSAAIELEEILGPYLSGGIVLGLEPAPEAEHLFRYFQGDHPIPSQRNIAASAEIIALLKDLRSDDLVIFVISGGGSTLLCQPKHHDLKLEQALFAELTKLGATIQEINTVRKHLSLARGGWLADYAYPAQAVALIFSDVPGNDLGFVASGPTVFDATTIFHADFILDKYQLRTRLKLPNNFLIESPKHEKNFARTRNLIVVSNQIALEAVAHEAKALGLRPVICDTAIFGEARLLSQTILKVLHQSSPGTVLLYGGETTVKVLGKGQGGRNQELVLSALEHLKDNELILSLATDGHDNGPHGGALGDSKTLAEAKVLGLSVAAELADNNSAHFFAQTGDYLKIGPTGANVSDLIFALKSR